MGRAGGARPGPGLVDNGHDLAAGLVDQPGNCGCLAIWERRSKHRCIGLGVIGNAERRNFYVAYIRAQNMEKTVADSRRYSPVPKSRR